MLKESSGLALSQFCMNVWIGLPGLKTVWIDTTNGLYSVSQGIFHVPYHEVREFHQAGTNAENAVYGNAGAGRICYATKTILISIWIIFIGIPSNTASTKGGRLSAFKFSSICGAGYLYLAGLTGDILEISVFMQTNNSASGALTQARYNQP